MIARLSIHTNQGIVRLVFLIFQPSEVCPKNSHFRKFSYGPPFAILRKMAILDTIEKLAISLLIRLFSCRFSMIVRLSIHTNQGIVRLVFLIFQPSEVCSKNRPFLKIFLQSPLAFLPKMPILHTIEKRAISLLICVFSCGFLHCHNLGQLRFQSILIRILCDLYFLFFSLPKFAQKIGHF